MSTATATKTVNLFAAGTKVKKDTAKKPEKTLHQAPELEGKIEEFLSLKNRIEADTAKLKMIEGDIKSKGKEFFITMVKTKKIRPESFKIQDAKGAACLFMVMDKYTTVDETKAEILANYENVLESKTVYTINPEMVERYGEVLSNLILSSEEISDEDKPNIIAGELTNSIVKGTIERLPQYDNPEEIFELINPICSLRK